MGESRHSAGMPFPPGEYGPANCYPGIFMLWPTPHLNLQGGGLARRLQRQGRGAWGLLYRPGVVILWNVNEEPGDPRRKLPVLDLLGRGERREGAGEC